MIYRQLGLKMRSPTINMFCRSGREYIDFLKNYKFYLEKEMKIYSEGQQIQNDNMISEGNFHYPKGALEEKIVWILSHSIYADEGISAWNRRRKRVNFDNVAVVMAIIDDEDAYAFQELPFDKKIGFYYKDLGLKDIIYVKEWEDLKLRAQLGYNFYRCTVAINRVEPITSIPLRVDWIRFLNGKSDYLRYM